MLGGDGEASQRIATAILEQMSGHDGALAEAFSSAAAVAGAPSPEGWSASWNPEAAITPEAPGLPELQRLSTDIRVPLCAMPWVMQQVPWPLSLIIKDTHLQRYEAVARFLLSIRVCHVRIVRCKHSATRAGALAPLLLRLRVGFLHFLNNLSNYATTRVGTSLSTPPAHRAGGPRTGTGIQGRH